MAFFIMAETICMEGGDKLCHPACEGGEYACLAD